MTKEKLFASSVTALTALALASSVAFAHVVTTPDEVGVGVRQDFSVGVPNEKDIPTTQLRLVIPDGLASVTPYVKPGWEIEVKKTGEGEDAKVTEIIWSGGEVGEGLRDSFGFRAMTPTEATTLTWKAYQTYSDGTVVSWDQEPKEEGHDEEDETKGPFSETKVVNDLATTGSESKTDQTTMWVAYGALLLGSIALALGLKTRMAR